MSKPIIIESVFARELIDSRGFPTVEVEIAARRSDGTSPTIRTTAMVPSGASTGDGEALELRDGDRTRFHGKGVLHAVENVNKKIAPSLRNQEFARQTILDDHLIELDGTPNKSGLGANAILGVSLAYARAEAMAYNTPLYSNIASNFESNGTTLPVPLMNVINGGAHADNELAIQEFMIVPAGFSSFRDALRAGCEIFHTLKKIIHAQGLSTNVGDEGGFAPNFHGENLHEQALSVLVRAIKDSGYKPGKDVFLALDSASSEFSKKEKPGSEILYNFEGSLRTSLEMIEIYSKWINAYPILSIEDGLSEHDWNGWKLITEKLGSKCQLVGDDLFVTNSNLLKKGIENETANSILIKPNQIGTVTETLETVKMAQKSGYTAVTSHRSGETEDTFIADLAVGTDCGQIKTGSASRTDRIAKYNQLLRIEERLGSQAKFAGLEGFGKLKRN